MKRDLLNFTCWNTSGDSITEVSIGIHLWPDGQVRGKIGYMWRMHPPKKTEAVPALVRAIHLSPCGISLRKERELDPLLLVPPRTVAGIELVIRGDSKTVVDWINVKAKQNVSYRAIETIQIQLMEWWEKGGDLCQRIGDWAVHIFREHNKEADLWAGLRAKGISMEWNDESRFLGWELH